MCTAITYQADDFYFGRTLDYARTFGEQITVTPRRFAFTFGQVPALTRHYAMIGMAHVRRGFPLYYEAVNEKGLAIAGLNFPESAVYHSPAPGCNNIAQFELIPWLLGQCADTAQALALLQTATLTDTAFDAHLPPARLHWLLADKARTLTLEPLHAGLHIAENPAGVLANEPPFAQQMFRLNDYMALSPHMPENRFAPQLALHACSSGMGALGLPGDTSSGSRFVRAAFARANAPVCRTEPSCVGQFFHMLDTVSQCRGCSLDADGGDVITQYTCCCNTRTGRYYYTTYDNRQISAVDLHAQPLDGSELICFRPVSSEHIHAQNRSQTEK